MFGKEKLTYHKFELIDAMEYCMEHFEHEDEKVKSLAREMANKFYSELQEVQRQLDNWN